jgi:uncharacterized protein
MASWRARGASLLALNALGTNMRYNVAGLLKSPTGTVRDVDLDAPIDLGEPDVEALAPVRGCLHLIRDHAGVLVEGQFTTTVGVACARCLAPVALHLSCELEESFRPVAMLPGGPPPVRRDEWEAATQIDDRHILDLTEVVRQAVLVAVPLHPLCRSECAGLCPRCGRDLNTGDCDCPPEPDPRWAGLRVLLDEIETDAAQSGAGTVGG